MEGTHWTKVFPKFDSMEDYCPKYTKRQSNDVDIGRVKRSLKSGSQIKKQKLEGN